MSQVSETRSRKPETQNLISDSFSHIPEVGGRTDGTEPVNRFGEWTKDSRCIDF